jgi:hypothetical protein
MVLSLQANKLTNFILVKLEFLIRTICRRSINKVKEPYIIEPLSKSESVKKNDGVALSKI